MKQRLTITAEGVDLTVTIEGLSPPGIQRMIRSAVHRVAADFVAKASVLTEITAEDAE